MAISYSYPMGTPKLTDTVLGVQYEEMKDPAVKNFSIGDIVTLAAEEAYTPTLQQVLDNNHDLVDGNNFQGTGAGVGNSGNYVNGLGSNAATGNSGNYVNALGSGAGDDNTFHHVNLFGKSATADENCQTVLSKDGTIMARISTTDLTATRKYNLPDANGPIALQTYKIWRAVINYNSVIRVLIDEIGFTSPTISNPFNGVVYVTKAGFFTSLDPNKLEFISTNLNNSGQVFVTLVDQGGGVNPNNQFQVNIYDMTGGQSGTPSGNVTVEIRIYN